jgi:1-phosphatidylinositol-4-phosphate 5-kinase
MLNNLPSILDIHEIYDLKGSSVGRYSSVDLPLKRLKALKDLDFESFYPHGIRIPHEIYRRLKLTMENDIYELRKMMITDFSLMLGVYQLDEYLQENGNDRGISKPQLGISLLFAATNIDRTAIESNDSNEKNEKVCFSESKLIKKFIMKPLHLIACPQENTFNDNTMATSLLG